MQMRVVLAAVWLVCGTTMLRAAAPDMVKNAEGTTLASGRVTSVTPTKVTVEGTGGEKEISANDIAQITYEGEPGSLKTVRKHLADRNYTEVLDILEKVELPASARKDIQADADFYKAYASGKLAQSGNGDPIEAGRMLVAFTTAHANSYHYYDAIELLGDLLLLAQRYDNAIEFFNRVAQAPWPNRKMRAAVALGRTYLFQNKAAEAARSFDAAAAINATGDEADALRAEAGLGKLRCAALAGKPEDVLPQVEAFIAKADPEQTHLLALAYNIRGLVHRKAGKNKQALMDYLHTDVLYSSNPEAHAEALAALIDLFGEEKQSERVSRLKQTLADQYPNSPWIKK
jgi:hypothetical protein